jgi:8-oxo-dGTP pyrophosphatase MutT (NUDIX family)
LPGRESTVVSGSAPVAAGPAADPEAPYVRLAVVGLVPRTEDGRWLVLHRTEPADSWDPPGGRLERREDLVQAVVRELGEETGLRIRDAVPCYAYLTVYKGERLLAVSMACRPVCDPGKVTLEVGGASGWRWVSEAEWLSLAVDGRTSWNASDIMRATCAAKAVWSVEGS